MLVSCISLHVRIYTFLRLLLLPRLLILLLHLLLLIPLCTDFTQLCFATINSLFNDLHMSLHLFRV